MSQFFNFRFLSKATFGPNLQNRNVKVTFYRKGISFELVSESGNPPNNIFIMSSDIDGTLYEGMGRSKKDAKKNVATQILKEVYNLVYPTEVTSMDESV